MTIELRPYQQEAVDAVRERFAHGYRSVLVVSPTATGKTVMFVTVAGHAPGSVLVLANRSQLVTQAAQRFGQFAPDLAVGVEMGARVVADDLEPDVVCATVQSMVGRLGRYAPDAFALIIVDEAHHAVAAQYRAIFDHFADARIAGFTATPDRLDGQGLGEVFDVLGFQYEIRDAAREGWIAPLRSRRIVVESFALDRVKTKRGGDYDDADLERALLEERTLHEVAAPLIEQAGERPTIVFSPGVQHAHAMAEVLRGYGATAVSVDGSMNRARIGEAVDDVAAGRTQFLTNCALFTEGFDLPGLACVAVARPTKSRALYTQMVGRGFRLAEGKRDLLVLDFTGGGEDHGLMCPADVLDGNADAEITARVRELESEGMPTHEALDVAEQERREVMLGLRADVRYTVRPIQPFDFFAVSERTARLGTDPITEEQRRRLSGAGLKLKSKEIKGLDRSKAGVILDAFKTRAGSGLCTFAQARALRRFDVPVDPARMTFDEASRLLDQHFTRSRGRRSCSPNRLWRR